MKKLLSIILALGIILSTVTACGTEVDEVENNTVTKYTVEGKTNELIPDETVTGELTVGVYGDDNFAKYGVGTPIDLVILKFQELYPNVDLNVERVTYETTSLEYYTKLSTNIMAGTGPDVFALALEGMDIEKMIQAGAFADMYEYFENDQSFNISDYNEKVFYAGQTGGKQYTIPIGYTFQSLLTTKSIAEKYGFDVNKCKDFYSCLEEISKLLQSNSDHKSPIDQFGIKERGLVAANINWIDFENKLINLDTLEMKTFFETLKNDFSPYMGQLTGGFGCDDNTGTSFSRNLESEKYLFIYLVASYEWLLSGANAINRFDEALAVPIRNVDGGITVSLEEQWAVRNNSSNKENAYRFLKIYLDPDYIQPNNIGIYRTSIPVSNKAVKQYLEKRFQTSPSFQKVSITEQSQNLIDAYLGFISEIDSVNHTMNNTRHDILYSEMQPYFDDEKTYDECIKNAQEYLELYISE